MTDFNIRGQRIPETSYPLPVVLNVSGANGLGIIRGLAEYGLRSLALDCQPDAIGFASRHAMGMTCPDPHVEPDRFISFLAALGKRMQQKGVLLIAHDTYLAEVAKQASELSPYFHFTAAAWSVLQRVMDKKVQYETAEAQGVAVPRTFFLDDSPPDEIDPNALAWPAILKAQFGKSFSRAIGRQVIIVDSIQEVRAACDAFKGFSLMLQEIIPGGDDQLYSFGSCLGRSGEVLASVTGRKIRQHPAGFGTALVAENLPTCDLSDRSTRLLRAMDFFGPSQVEFKLDPQDGRFKLMEINARFWKWHSLATACGANVAYAAYRDACGDPIELQTSVETHRFWTMSLDDFVMTGRRVYLGKYPWRSWCKPYTSRWIDGISSWHDPLPGLSYVWRMFRLAVSRVRGSRHIPAAAMQGQEIGRPVGVEAAIARAENSQAEGIDDRR